MPHLLQLVGIVVLTEELLHALEFTGLALGEVLFVGGATCEGQRVVRELGVLLMENIILSVVPVREGRIVGARLLNGLGRARDFLDSLRRFLSLLAPILRFVRRGQVHFVRVDNLALLLKVKGLLMALDLRLGQLLIEVLAIVGEERLGVGVAHEPVSAARRARPLVSRRQRLDCTRNTLVNQRMMVLTCVAVPHCLVWTTACFQAVLSVVFPEASMLLPLSSGVCQAHLCL